MIRKWKNMLLKRCKVAAKQQHLAMVAQECKERAAKITIEWLKKLEQQEADRKAAQAELLHQKKEERKKCA